MVSTRALNRALLARQLLLERAAAPPGEVAARVCGLQTQHAPSGYIGIWSRTTGLRKADLTAALERAEVVQGWVMRNTIHMVAAADYGPFTDAVRPRGGRSGCGRTSAPPGWTCRPSRTPCGATWPTGR